MAVLRARSPRRRQREAGAREGTQGCTRGARRAVQLRCFEVLEISTGSLSLSTPSITSQCEVSFHKPHPKHCSSSIPSLSCWVQFHLLFPLYVEFNEHKMGWLISTKLLLQTLPFSPYPAPKPSCRWDWGLLGAAGSGGREAPAPPWDLGHAAVFLPFAWLPFFICIPLLCCPEYSVFPLQKTDLGLRSTPSSEWVFRNNGLAFFYYYYCYYYCCCYYYYYYYYYLMLLFASGSISSQYPCPVPPPRQRLGRACRC